MDVNVLNTIPYIMMNMSFLIVVIPFYSTIPRALELSLSLVVVVVGGGDVM